MDQFYREGSRFHSRRKADRSCSLNVRKLTAHINASSFDTNVLTKPRPDRLKA